MEKEAERSTERGEIGRRQTQIDVSRMQDGRMNEGRRIFGPLLDLISTNEEQTHCICVRPSRHWSLGVSSDNHYDYDSTTPE